MSENKVVSLREYEEKEIQPKSGWAMLFVSILFVVGGFVGFAMGIFVATEISPLGGLLILAGAILFVLGIIFWCGLKIIAPNEAVVLVLFGKYIGTVARDGFYFVNPFASKSRVSLKARTLVNDKQKVNDEMGNPIEIGVIVIWKVANTAKALFKVENYTGFITTQADSAIRNVARQYPYDVSEQGDEKSLRGSAQEIADVLKAELQQRVEIAGIDVLEARISHLAYAPEIAAAMLQRQQAVAIIEARQKIVDGAVSMVEMALHKLSENKIVELDDDKKAAMVSNLLVVLCGNKDAQPIVNSGTL